MRLPQRAQPIPGLSVMADTCTTANLSWMASKFWTQARTMSLSVNELVTAQNAVFASLSERRNDWVQARDRLDRNGQKGSHVTFWNVYAPGTVDEVMLDRHKDRGDLEKALLDHIRATPRRRL